MEERVDDFSHRVTMGSTSTEGSIESRQSTTNDNQVLLYNRTKRRREKKDAPRWLLFLPVMEVVVPLITTISCYGMAVARNDLLPPPYVPFPTEIGQRQPQSCLFTLGMSCDSILSMLIVLLRYRQVSLLHEGWWNRLALLCGSLAATFKLVLASFQFGVTHVHAFSCAGHAACIVCYSFLQAHLTNKTRIISGRYLYFARLLLAILIATCALVVAVFLQLNRQPKNVAPIVSWALVALTQIFALTFSLDVRFILFSFDIWVPPKVMAVSKKRSFRSNLSLFERTSTVRSQKSVRKNSSFSTMSRRDNKTTGPP